MTQREEIERLQKRIAEDLSTLLGITGADRVELELTDLSGVLVMHIVAQLGPGALEGEESAMTSNVVPFKPS